MKICGHTTVNGFCHGFYDVIDYLSCCAEKLRIAFPPAACISPCSPLISEGIFELFFFFFNTSESKGLKLWRANPPEVRVNVLELFCQLAFKLTMLLTNSEK